MLPCFNVLEGAPIGMNLANRLKSLLEVVESRLYIGTALLEARTLQWND